MKICNPGTRIHIQVKSSDDVLKAGGRYKSNSPSGAAIACKDKIESGIHPEGPALLNYFTGPRNKMAFNLMERCMLGQEVKEASPAVAEIRKPVMRSKVSKACSE